MDTSKLKRFAPASRSRLIEQIGVKLDYVLTTRTPDLIEAESLVRALRKSVEREGREAVIEKVAYLWFNRFAAIRYLDAREWHPFRARVITSANQESVLPDLFQQVRGGGIPEELADYLPGTCVADLLDGRLPSGNPQGEVQRLIIIAVCNYYADILPHLFTRLDDFTQLLLPDDVLTEQSIPHGFRAEISDGDCAEVEVLGWLYQFYISEKKDEVMARKKAVPSEDIPSVTQLFTPHWIVRYLVENSLGRLWLRSRPDSRLREHMPYYVEDPTPEPPVWESGWERYFPYAEHEWRSRLWLRPNLALKDDCESVTHYALTIDGYAYAREVWGIPDASSGGAAAKLDSMFQDGKITGSFEDLRAALFLWQRATKWGESKESFRNFPLFYQAVCEAWEKEWRKHEIQLPDLTAHGIRVPETSTADSLTVATPEEIKLLDPACGSAHMLTYAFDLLVKIYEEEGYAPGEIAEKILTHNLFGLEICPRAAQLAQFALLCKAREQSRNAFRRPVQPQIMCLQNVVITPEEMQAWSAATGVTFGQNQLSQIHQFRENTETFGALIQPVFDGERLAALRAKIQNSDLTTQNSDLLVELTQRKLHLVLNQAELLSQRYQVVVANPPYMGGKSLGEDLRKFLARTLTEGKNDLFAAFLLRVKFFCMPFGYEGFITFQNWMFISTYEELRRVLLSATPVLSLIHCGRGLWGSDFGSCAFILQNGGEREARAGYFRLFERQGEVNQNEVLESRFLSNSGSPQYFATSRDLARVPGAPIAYWISHQLSLSFENEKIDSTWKSGGRCKTHKDAKFVRFSWEIGGDELNNANNWKGYCNGGDFRKWYGNLYNVFRWTESSRDFYKSKGGLSNPKTWNREGVTWSDITIAVNSFRLKPPYCEYSSLSPTLLAKESQPPENLLAFLNSRVGREMLRGINPTLHANVGDVCRLPLKKSDSVERLAQGAISVSRIDWDNSETSWDFLDLPLLRPGDWEVEPGQPGGPWKGRTLAESWEYYSTYCAAAIQRMQELETENNRLWIDAYGLQDELTPEVPEKEITLARAHAKKDMASFVSYAVGCMMGRYCLDAPGLICSNAGDTVEDYLRVVNEKGTYEEFARVQGSGFSAENWSFAPDDDGIIPITEDDWFEDDAASRVREFLKATFDPGTVDENVAFIEEALGKTLRKYFTAGAGGFYADHLKTYKKRPIYWMFESPKKHFRALVYLHRYNKDTVNTLLTGYLREFINKLTSTIDQLEHATDRAPADDRRLDKLKIMLRDSEDYERELILPLAQERIDLDLDDGVKANYPKFGKALTKIPGVS